MPGEAEIEEAGEVGSGAATETTQQGQESETTKTVGGASASNGVDISKLTGQDAIDALKEQFVKNAPDTEKGSEAASQGADKSGGDESDSTLDPNTEIPVGKNAKVKLGELGSYIDKQFEKRAEGLRKAMSKKDQQIAEMQARLGGGTSNGAPANQAASAATVSQREKALEYIVRQQLADPDAAQKVQALIQQAEQLAQHGIFGGTPPGASSNGNSPAAVQNGEQEMPSWLAEMRVKHEFDRLQETLGLTLDPNQRKEIGELQAQLEEEFTESLPEPIRRQTSLPLRHGFNEWVVKQILPKLMGQVKASEAEREVRAKRARSAAPSTSVAAGAFPRPPKPLNKMSEKEQSDWLKQTFIEADQAGRGGA